MTVIGEAFIAVRPDSKGFGSATEKQVESGLGGAVKKVAAVIGGAVAIAGVEDFVESLVDAARESERLQKQTEAVLRSTGGAAGVSAEQVDKLSTSLSRMTGIDDEAIQNNENLLLTFTNIKNRVGEGNDIFSQATALTLDMSKALGQDMASSSIQLGKALNDPVKGITALQRVGVAFTEQQKEQIKTLVASGDTLGAQKIILRELSTEFGGSAAAQATAADRLAVTWDNLKETLGKKLLPIIDTVAGFLADKLPGALDATFDAFGHLGSIVSTVFEAFQVLGGDDGPQGFGEIMDNLLGNSGQYVGFFRGLGDSILTIIGIGKQLFDVLFRGDFSGGPLSEDSPIIDGAFKIREAIAAVVEFVESHWKPVLIGAGAVLLALTSPVTAVVAGFVLLYAKSQLVRDVVAGMLTGFAVFAGFMSETVLPIVLKVVGFIVDQITHLAQWWSDHWENMEKAVRNVLFPIVAVIVGVVASIMFVWNHFGEQITAVVVYAWSQVQNIVETAMRIIGDVVAFFTDLLAGDWGAAWDDVKDILAAAVDFLKTSLSNLLRFIVDYFSSLPKNMLRALGDLARVFLPVGANVVKGLISGIASMLGALAGQVAQLPGAVLSALGDVATWLLESGRSVVTGLWNGMKAVWDAEVHFYADLPGKILDAMGAVATWLLDAGRDVLSGLWDGIKEVWNREVHFWSDLPGIVLGALGDTLSWLRDAGVNALTGLWNGIQSMSVWLVQQVLGIPGWILDALWDAADWLHDVAVNVIVGFWHGLESMKDWIVDKVKGFFGGIVGGIGSFLGIGSPSKVFMRIGAYTGEGFALGLESTADRVAAASKLVMSKLSLDTPALRVASVRSGAANLIASTAIDGLAARMSGASSTSSTRDMAAAVHLTFGPGSIVLHGDVSERDARKVGRALVDGAQQRLHERALAVEVRAS